MGCNQSKHYPWYLKHEHFPALESNKTLSFIDLGWRDGVGEQDVSDFPPQLPSSLSNCKSPLCVVDETPRTEELQSQELCSFWTGGSLVRCLHCSGKECVPNMQGTDSSLVSLSCHR